MDALEMIVLAASILTTAWLYFYVHWHLPLQQEERMRQTLKAFGTAIELRFPSHEGLSTRVIALADAVGKVMGLSRSALRDLEMAGRLRDIGLCAIPYTLVNENPVANWTAAELATYNRHAEVSGAMLELVPSLRHLAETIRCHHTRFAGPEEDGVPRGSDIPVQARILKSVTEYVWVERWYGAAAAHKLLLDGRGFDFCPESVDALLSVLTSVRVDEPRESVAV